MSHTSAPPAEIEAIVETDEIGRIRITANADPETIFQSNDADPRDDGVDQNAREYLEQEFNVVRILEVT